MEKFIPIKQHIVVYEQQKAVNTVPKQAVSHTKLKKYQYSSYLVFIRIKYLLIVKPQTRKAALIQ